VSYRSLLNDDLRSLEGVVEANESNRSGLTIKPLRFSRRGGRVEGDQISYDGIDAAGHILFGPFIKLPIGFYRVEFDFTAEGAEADPHIFAFDVSVGNKFLAQLVTGVRDLEERGQPALEFENKDPTDPLEFRVHSRLWPNGRVTFRGVRLFRLNSASDVPYFSFDKHRKRHKSKGFDRFVNWIGFDRTKRASEYSRIRFRLQTANR
jgi:hypothetical protein